MVATDDEIVIVDDLEAISEMIKENLILRGFSKIETYNNSEIAIKEIKTKNMAPIIITDYSMPNKNGLELLNEIKKHFLKIKGVVITQDTEEVLSKNKNYRVIEKDKNLYTNLMAWFANN